MSLSPCNILHFTDAMETAVTRSEEDCSGRVERISVIALLFEQREMDSQGGQLRNNDKNTVCTV